MQRIAGNRLGVILLVVVSIPVLASAEAGLEYIRTLQGESLNTFPWMFKHFLLPWAELAACVPVPMLLARRFALRPATLWVHLAGAVVFGVTHLALDVLVAKLLWDAPLTLVGGTANLISWYLLRDVFIYGTIAGVVLVFDAQRALRARELDLTRTRLAALQARLEPHFLFNTLNTAVMMVRSDQREAAVQVLLELSELLRTVVRSDPARRVTLKEEWEFIGRYLALEAARFPDRLTVDMRCDASLEPLPVPFLILQPLVENAVRHGVARQSGPGAIAVRADQRDGVLRLSVQDNGPGPTETNGGGVGLSTVRDRLRELYGSRGSLELGQAPGGGSLAVVTLPLN